MDIETHKQMIGRYIQDKGMQDADDFVAEDWQEQTLVCDMRKNTKKVGTTQSNRTKWTGKIAITLCNPQEETNKYAIGVCWTYQKSKRHQRIWSSKTIEKNYTES